MGRTEMRPKALALGGAWLHNGPERETIAAIHRAIELGIDYLDTYAGHAEERWGKALGGGLREKIYLQAKVGPHPARRKDFSAEATRWSVENSLQAFKTDYLDAVLIHDPVEIEDILTAGQALDELLKMKAEGLVRHIGLGVRSHEFHRIAIETGQIDIILTFLDYTLLNQSAAQTTLPLARTHDIGIILASPLGMGSLTGVEPSPEAEARRHPSTPLQAHAMWRWCQVHGVNIRHLAMQICLSAPIDGVVMFGPSNKRHVEEAYEAATADIPEDVWREFETAFALQRFNV